MQMMTGEGYNIQIGDYNKNINIVIGNNEADSNVKRLIEENKALRSNLDWAMQQIRIKDTLLKMFCNEP